MFAGDLGWYSGSRPCTFISFCAHHESLRVFKNDRGLSCHLHFALPGVYMTFTPREILIDFYPKPRNHN